MGYTLKSLERTCGFGNSTIAKWDKNIPSIDKVLRVCSVLEVPLSAVVDDPYAKENAPAVPGESVLSDIEKAFILWLRSLPPEKRQAVLNFQDMF